MIVQGSARLDGNTALSVAALADRLAGRANVISLAARNVAAYDYRGSADDDFPGFVRTMIASPRIVFATPVYWYAMSGLLKTVFDRFTDLLASGPQAPGRMLAGRRVWLLATGTDPELPAGFDVPFMRTAAYFGMDWRGGCYIRFAGTCRPADPALSPLDALAAELAA